MPIQTRQQRYFALALEQITELRMRNDQEFSQKAKTAYGGLCHSLPFLIRNDGLCQAVAWIEEKANGDVEAPLTQAYRELRNHMAMLLGEPNGDRLLARIQMDGVVDYMRDTRELLDAWVYYKRFASSVLGVDASVDATDALEIGVTA